jgi:hypothetical protein
MLDGRFCSSPTASAGPCSRPNNNQSRIPSVRAPVQMNGRLRAMLHTRWTQLGAVVAECGASGREVVARCPGLARWRRTSWDTGERPNSMKCLVRTMIARACLVSVPFAED